MKKPILLFFILILTSLGLFFYWRTDENAENLEITNPTQTSYFSNTPSLSPRATSSPKPSAIPQIILLQVPFAAQAPFGEWSDPTFQDACEEASVLMAVSWLNKKKSLTKDEAKAGILAISDFEDKKYGYLPDRSAGDTAQLLKDYSGYQNAFVKYNVVSQNIIDELKNGNLVIVPVNGQILKNPFYTAPGPLHHMLVIIGFDAKKNEFITNDSGTRHGENYRYSAKIIENSLADYPTGYHLEAQTKTSAAIIVQPKT